MYRPVCVSCSKEMYPLKNGVDYIESMVINDVTEPYKIIQCDMFECPICGYRILSGFAQESYTEHFHDDFQRIYNAIKQRGKESIDWVQERK